MKRRRYKHPPIEEAVAEFRFEPSQEWDFTMPGRLHGELREEYPGKPRQQNAVQAHLMATHDEAANIAVRGGLVKVHLVTEDASRLVAIGPDVLSVHMLRPYQRNGDSSGWDEFRPRIVQALTAYWNVAEPYGVKRIGLRYINKVVIPESNVEAARYLRAAPPNVDGLPEQVRRSVGRAEYVYPDEVQLLVEHATNEASEGLVVSLDIDVIWQSIEAVDRDAALATVDDLRTREREVFEALITDDARTLFDAT